MQRISGEGMLDKMIQATLGAHSKGGDVLEGMSMVAERFRAGDFYGISDECVSVVRDIQDVFACDYFAASSFFAAEMRSRYGINVH